MILLEEDPAFFDGAISLAEDVRGYHNSEYQVQQPEWRDRLPRLAEGMWTAMGRLAALPVEEMDVAFMKPATREGTAMQELDYWEASIDASDLGAEPITRARDPLDAPQPAAPGAEAGDGPRRFPRRQLPL